MRSVVVVPVTAVAGFILAGCGGGHSQVAAPPPSPTASVTEATLCRALPGAQRQASRTDVSTPGDVGCYVTWHGMPLALTYTPGISPQGILKRVHPTPVPLSGGVLQSPVTGAVFAPTRGGGTLEISFHGSQVDTQPPPSPSWQRQRQAAIDEERRRAAELARIAPVAVSGLQKQSPGS